MHNYRLLIDQLIELTETSNDHSHLGKFKWLLKYKNYINSIEELEATQPHEKVVSVENDIIDHIHPSSAPMGSVTVKTIIPKNKRNFFSRRRKYRGA